MAMCCSKLSGTTIDNKAVLTHFIVNPKIIALIKVNSLRCINFFDTVPYSTIVLPILA